MQRPLGCTDWMTHQVIRSLDRPQKQCFRFPTQAAGTMTRFETAQEGLGREIRAFHTVVLFLSRLVYLFIYLSLPASEKRRDFDEVWQRLGPEETSHRGCVHPDTLTTHTRRALSLLKRQYTRIFQWDANRLPQTRRTLGTERCGASKIQTRCMDVCMNYSVTIFFMANCITGPKKMTVLPQYVNTVVYILLFSLQAKICTVSYCLSLLN